MIALKGNAIAETEPFLQKKSEVHSDETNRILRRARACFRVELLLHFILIATYAVIAIIVSRVLQCQCSIPPNGK